MADRRPIRQRLAEFYTEAELDLWLYRPHPQFGGRAPRQLVDIGQAEDVHQLIDRMESGAFI